MGAILAEYLHFSLPKICVSGSVLTQMIERSLAARESLSHNLESPAQYHPKGDPTITANAI